MILDLRVAIHNLTLVINITGVTHSDGKTSKIVDIIVIVAVISKDLF